LLSTKQIDGGNRNVAVGRYIGAFAATSNCWCCRRFDIYKSTAATEPLPSVTALVHCRQVLDMAISTATTKMLLSVAGDTDDDQYMASRNGNLLLMP
jgi:hypothetical protein